ncbi:MAG: penicillin-binding protein activator LpoB [Verrucomicrobiales bacterium]|nr:penicillin-binding protein activator LpoB [Verrucomicrobiales bacterium]
MKPTLPMVIAAAVLAGGCASPKTSYVEADSSRLITTVEGINIQDFAQAADAMTASLIDNFINPGLLKSGVPGEPALMAISRIVNSTGQQLDTDMLIKKIRVTLLRTGKVQTSTTVAFGGVEDPLVAELGGAPKRRPDYTLSGKIIEDRTRAGKVRQSSYIFQLALSSLDGIAVWEDERIIVKQGSRPSVGF